MKMTKLTDKQIRYAIRERGKGKTLVDIADDIGVTPQHVGRLCAEFTRTGQIHVQQKPGRPVHPPPSAEEVRTVLNKHAEEDVGIIRTARRVRKDNPNISYATIYRIMKEHGLVTSSVAKSKKRKYVRYERKYSNAMWHVDWHIMKDQRFAGLNLVTFLDDSSRCITGAALFKEATSENVVDVLRQAIARFGTPATILSDNGRCFNGGRRHDDSPKGKWKPTAFEAELLDRGIEMINSRPYHPQTNGKLERFHGSIETEIHHYDSLSSYIEYYNERRLHFSLDIDNYETPLQAFSVRKATKAIREKDPKWMERDTDD